MVEFSISSDQGAISQSVAEVLHGKIPRGREELCNTLYDLMMGTIENGVEWFGHIELAVPVQSGQNSSGL